MIAQGQKLVNRGLRLVFGKIHPPDPLPLPKEGGSGGGGIKVMRILG